MLKRVTGQDPAAILGALQSNGRVFLLNPNGIVFGAGAQINVAGLVASTLNLSNDDFLNNRMRFTDGAGAGSVVNQGSITGGNVYLVGKSVSNEGLIASPNGEVVLAAGNSVELVNPGTPNLRVEIVAPDNEARNLGTISAEAGRIGIYAGLIKQGGTLNASSAVSEGGKILLKATQNTTLEAGSQTTASGATGGTIAIQSGDTTLVAGDIAATGSTGNGGTVHVLGNKVGLIDAASIDASGATGGGTVLVGGDYQGKNPDVQNAYRTYVGSEATIKADALTSGDGGKVIVWADDATRFYGDISARGGAIEGNGGFVEVSGKQWLDYRGSVDTRAPNGSAGTLLLDPSDITISNAATNGSDGGFSSGEYFAFGGSVTNIAWNDIVNELDSTNVIIKTSNISSGSGGFGDINILTASPDLSSTNTLELHAERNIVVGGSITNLQAGNIVMHAGYDGESYGFGAITLNAPISTQGQVWLNAGTGILQNSGAISASGLAVNAYGGPVTLDAAMTMNQVGTLSGSAVGMFAFKNSGNLTIGSVGGVNGITVNESSGRSSTINVAVTGGQLTVDSPVAAYGGGDGGEGQAGGNATITLASSSSMQINNSITAYGGAGSSGGSSIPAGKGGNATVNLTAGGGLTIDGSVYATGGQGGGPNFSFSGVTGGRGGDGVVNLTAAGNLTVAAYSSVEGQGGSGGDAYGGQAGRGGDGKVMMTAGSITVDSLGEVRAFGGSGGSATGSGSAFGGNGGNALVQMASTGSINVFGGVNVYGGWGGSGNGGDGNGGNAAASLTSPGGITISGPWAAVTAEGGEGGGFYGYFPSNGGTASVLLSSAGPIAITDGAYVQARGGDGGEYGVAGSALVMVSSSGGITVSNSGIMASGGDAYSGQGGAAAVTMAAGGNIQIEGGEGAAWGGSGATGGNAAVNVIAGGSITVSNNGGGGSSGACEVECFINFNGPFSNLVAISGYGNNMPGVSSVVVAAAGNGNLIDGAGIFTDGVVGLGGANIMLDNAFAAGYTGASVSATGSLSLMNGSELNSYGNAYITTGGNVTVDNSRISGNPEVVMNVGGVINMNNFGTIEAGSPSTILLTFPMLTSGGYFVNGVEGVVYDSGTGFVVLGDPAILGTNLHVTYGGVINIPTNSLIVAMGESTKPPDVEPEKDVFEDVKKEEKEAPVCR